MTIIKSKKVKEIIDNIEQEQQENRLNWEQKVDDWKEKHILQSEELEEVKKQLEEKITEVEFVKESAEHAKSYYGGLIREEKKKVQTIKKALEDKNESVQLSLLKENHEKEIRELKRSAEVVEKNYSNLSKDWLKTEDENSKLKKDLEEKEMLIEELKEKNRLIELSEKANLSGIRVAEGWWKREKKQVEDKLDKKIGVLENAGNGLLKQLHEEYDRNKDLKEYIEKLEKKLYEQGKSLKEEFKKNADQKTEIGFLQEQVDLTNELYLNKIPLPKVPSKFKIFREKTKTKFQHLIEKTKYKSQKLFAQVEVRVK